jgi:N6-adenosine-specific RNA methylase IME4/ParB-like chromosome segregation protein Spo0J
MSGNIKAVQVSNIVVAPNRMRALRPEMVAEIAESIQARGLLQPIVVRPRGHNSFWLVAGWHRLEAARELGLDSVHADIRDGLDADAAQLAEIDENLVRADLSPAERALHVGKRKDLYEKLHPEIKHGGDRKSAKAKSKSQNENLKAFVVDAAKKTGKGRSSDELDALGGLPEAEQRKLARRAKAGEKVTAREPEILKIAKAIRAGRIAQHRIEWTTRITELSKHNAPLPRDRRYPIILADPPWKFELHDLETGMQHTAEANYPTMETDAICALPIADLATPDAALFLWTTSPHLPTAFRVIQAWGFDYRTNVVWVKDKTGLGYWVRNQHELLLIAARGRFMSPAPAQRPPSVLNGPRREHSRKPDESYALIERMYPELPKIELFARSRRPGWDVWGNEALADLKREAAE